MSKSIIDADPGLTAISRLKQTFITKLKQELDLKRKENKQLPLEMLALEKSPIEAIELEQLAKILPLLRPLPLQIIIKEITDLVNYSGQALDVFCQLFFLIKNNDELCKKISTQLIKLESVPEKVIGIYLEALRSTADLHKPSLKNIEIVFSQLVEINKHIKGFHLFIANLLIEEIIIKWMKNFSSFSEDSQLKLIVSLFSDSFDIASNNRHKMLFKSIDIKNLIFLIKDNDDWMEFIITSSDHYVKILH